MIDLRKQRVGLEDALKMFETESKDRLKEFSRHKYFTPDNQRRRPAMHRRGKDNKGQRR